jgi:hypothetical protein
VGLELSNGALYRLRNGGAWGGRADDNLGAYFCQQTEKSSTTSHAAVESLPSPQPGSLAVRRRT